MELATTMHKWLLDSVGLEVLQDQICKVSGKLSEQIKYMCQEWLRFLPIA